jgi:hypothetical protein
MNALVTLTAALVGVGVGYALFSPGPKCNEHYITVGARICNVYTDRFSVLIENFSDCSINVRWMGYAFSDSKVAWPKETARPNFDPITLDVDGSFIIDNFWMGGGDEYSSIAEVIDDIDRCAVSLCVAISSGHGEEAIRVPLRM